MDQHQAARDRSGRRRDLRQFGSIVAFVILYAVASLLADHETDPAGAPPTSPPQRRVEASSGEAGTGTVVAMNRLDED